MSSRRSSTAPGWPAARYGPSLLLLLLGLTTTAGLWLRGHRQGTPASRPAANAATAPAAPAAVPAEAHAPAFARPAEGSLNANEAPASGAIGVSPADLESRGLLIPVDGVEAEDLRDSFDEGRRGHTHEAIDILAPRNTPVRAVEDGTVAKLFTSVPGGITLYQFDPSGDYCYYYAHLERYADDVANGKRVRRGEILGYVGTSGNAPKNTPHLHFAIYRLNANKHWWEGEALDPFPVLRRAP